MLAFEYYVWNTTAEVRSRMAHLYLPLANMLKKNPKPLLQHVEPRELRFYGKRYRLEGLQGYLNGIASGPVGEITCISGAEERC